MLSKDKFRCFSNFGKPEKTQTLLCLNQEEKAIYIAADSDFADSTCLEQSNFIQVTLSLMRKDGQSFNIFLTPLAIKSELPSKESALGIQKISNEIAQNLSQPEFNRVNFEQLVERVAKWGRIKRVMGKIKDASEDDLYTVWDNLRIALSDNNSEVGCLSDRQLVAIERILTTRIGFGIALTTKFLRLRDAHRFVVLDSVFVDNTCHSNQKKIRDNSIGYSAFLTAVTDCLLKYNHQNQAVNVELGDFEYSLYHLIREAKEEINKAQKKRGKKVKKGHSTRKRALKKSS